LSLAKSLASSGEKDEARLRSSISRAYYAAFCTARNHLRDEEHKIIPDENVHSYVINQLYCLGKRSNGRKLALELRRLRNHRNRADYDDSISGLSSMSQDALIRSERIVSHLRK
jgi:uncharacterized protein (UPF0332 family)